MKLLLKDCVKYVPYEYKNEVELENMVFEHYKEIFGEDSLLFSKKKIKSPAKIGTIPDAFVINFKSRRWFVVEVELSKHQVYEHIVAQITKFINATKSPESRQELAKIIYNKIKSDPYKKALLEVNGIKEDKFKAILEILEVPPEIVVIIDNLTEKVKEAIDLLSNALNFNVKAIEFKTFKRKNSHSLDDHIHLFDWFLKTESFKGKKEPKKLKGRHLVKKMIEAGILYPGFKIYGKHKGKLYEAEILEDGRIRVINDGTIHTSLSRAADHITKSSVDGWHWWKYKDEYGHEHEIDELRQKYLQQKII